MASLPFFFDSIYTTVASTAISSSNIGLLQMRQSRKRRNKTTTSPRLSHAPCGTNPRSSNSPIRLSRYPGSLHLCPTTPYRPQSGTSSSRERRQTLSGSASKLISPNHSWWSPSLTAIRMYTSECGRRMSTE